MSVLLPADGFRVWIVALEKAPPPGLNPNYFIPRPGRVMELADEAILTEDEARIYCETYNEAMQRAQKPLWAIAEAVRVTLVGELSVGQKVCPVFNG